MMRSRLVLLLAPFLLATLTQCSTFRYDPSALHRAYGHLSACSLNDEGLSIAAREALVRAGISSWDVKMWPLRSLRTAEAHARRHPRDLAFQQALMEQNIAVAKRLAPDNPEGALVLYLRAADLASRYLKTYAPEDWPFLFQLNQYATARVVELLAPEEGTVRSRSVSFEGTTYEVEIPAMETGPRVDPFRFGALRAADCVQIHGLSNRVTQVGLGAAFVGEVTSIVDGETGTYRSGGDAFLPLGGLFQPLSVVLEFEGKRVELTCYDVQESSSIVEGRREHALAADFTAAWAQQLEVDPYRNGVVGMLRPGITGDYMGLTMMEPFRKEAIPVIFIHGLASRGATWDEMINGLLEDRRIRERYQFWLYQYPSGYHFLIPAADLRRELRSVRRRFDPADRWENLDRMVLVGHSMGGLISSALIRRADESSVAEFFKRPIRQMATDEETLQQLRDLFFLESDDSIRRVVFLATPHRGSTLADGWAGRLLARLIKMPRELVSFNLKGIVQELTDSGLSVLDVGRNSVTRLQYYNPTLKRLLNLPKDRRVTVHTIVGDRGLGNAPHSSDGVVSYASSHLPDAESEKIVSSWHGVQDHPQTIDEVRRILLEHLEE